jgi:hypothetical protein
VPCGGGGLEGVRVSDGGLPDGDYIAPGSCEKLVCSCFE